MSPASPTRTTAITLAGMRFHVRVGIMPHERERPQPLEVDLTACRVGDAPEILDYRTLYALVAAVVGAEPLDYLEEVADEILTRVLALPAVASARVAIRKPHVSLGGPLGHAEVVVEAGRG